MNIEAMIKDNVMKINGSGCKVYVSPEIPEKKLDNAIASIANGVDPNFVLAVVDTTLFGSAKEGMVLIGDRIYINNHGKKEIMFVDINSIEKREYTERKENGEEETIYKYFMKYKGEEEDITRNISCTNKDGFVEFITQIIQSIEEEETALESTNQTCPLAMMSAEIKEAYLKVICNYAYSDDNMIDSKEYSEIMTLIAMNSVEKEVRIAIRAYMYDGQQMESNEKLIDILEDLVDAGSLEALKLSIIKDTINLHWSKMSETHEGNEWKNCEYIVKLASLLEIDDDKVNCIAENIQKNKDILVKRQDNIQIKKTMQELAAKGGAVGVPLAAVYLSGSVVGVSAAGMTSGLAALGMGGVAGFSSMFTGIGVAVLLGVGAYKGVKKVTGMGELEKNKQREMMLQEIIKNSQKALNYLIEDVNEVTYRLQEAIKSGQETEFKVQKLAGILAMMSKGAKQTTDQIDFAEKEKLLCRLPGQIKNSLIEELAPGATKKPIRELIYNAYTISKTDGEGKPLDNCINTELSADELQEVYNSLEGIGYYNMAENTKAQALNAAKGAAKGLMKGLRG